MEFEEQRCYARSLFELQSLNEKNNIRFKGERNEENTVTLPLRIADFRGKN
ncbi:hypothetical protein Hanom_Chr00s017600g01757201 [Helianthus anomalus]